MKAARIVAKTKSIKNPSNVKKNNFKAKTKGATSDIRKRIKTPRKGRYDMDSESVDEMRQPGDYLYLTM